jgi:DNA-binding PadR family transcriptional regulator
MRQYTITASVDSTSGVGRPLEGPESNGRSCKWEAVVGRESVGELEHLILLAIAALGREAGALEVRRRLEAEGRALTRGALYRSLDRLGEKALIEWDVEEPGSARGGHARRVYRLSPEGREAVRERRATLESLWSDAVEALG